MKCFQTVINVYQDGDCNCACTFDDIFPADFGCISLLLPSLSKLPCQCYSNEPGSLGNLGSNKGMQFETSGCVSPIIHAVDNDLVF